MKPKNCLQLGIGAVIAVFVASLVSTVAQACTDQLANTRSPYSVVRFQPVLDQAKLQAPLSDTCFAQGSGENDLSNTASYNKWFYAPQTEDFMVFSMTRDEAGSMRRSELRQMQEWQPDTHHHMEGDVRFDLISDDLGEFTFMQIHHKTDGAKPILRLIYHRERSGIKNGLWAVYRHCADPGSICNQYTKTLLGTWTPSANGQGFKHFAIDVEDNHLTVSLDGDVKFEQELDPSYADARLYFKAGAYLQTAGTATLVWNDLSIDQ